MLQKIQTKYELTDYQTKLLKYYLMVFFGETGKLLAIGCLFPNQYPIYLWCVLLLAVIHTATGGAHCHTYLGCLAASAVLFVLCIDVLPYVEILLIWRITLLIACGIINCHIGPVMTRERRARFQDEERLAKSTKRALFRVLSVIGCFIIYSCCYPETILAKAGFWIILLDALQLTAAKITNLIRKED
ncbi:MAG: accessory gene regulator B family protein [Lachnospiraceae bacterium]|nr:accessory gene regulator B family protein [Lachnospiraceae bacterium]